LKLNSNRNAGETKETLGEALESTAE